MKTFSIVDPKDAFRAWNWIRGQIGKGVSLRLIAELESEPIPQARRALLWRCLDQLALQVVLESGLRLTARQWHQVACQRALGFDYADIGKVSHMVAREPKSLTGADFDAVASEVITLCRTHSVDLRKIDNGTGQLDGSPP